MAVGLPVRKALLFKAHSRLLLGSALSIFLRPSNFSAQEWSTLRASLVALDPQAKLSVLRPGLLPALLRSPQFRNFDQTQLRSHLQGPLAVLTLPHLDPPSFTKLLSTLDAISTSPGPKEQPHDPKSKTPRVVIQRLQLLSTLIHNRALDVPATQLVAKLPPLPVLHSQIIGLIGGASRSIVGIVGARGQEVARTLEGFKQGLEQPAAPSPSP